MLTTASRLTFALALTIVLGACASNEEKPAAPTPPPPVIETTAAPVRAVGDIQRIADLERQLAREQRQNAAEKRRLEQALKESQKQSEDLQKKLDALLNIDRELRNRGRHR